MKLMMIVRDDLIIEFRPNWLTLLTGLLCARFWKD
jgi:hypothetical protein